MDALVTLCAVISGSVCSVAIMYFFVVKNMVHKKEIEIAYLKGKCEGEKEGLGKIGIKYEGYIEENSTFLTSYIETGIYSQIIYNGFPIGEKTKNVLSIKKLSKDENIEKLTTEIMMGIERAVASVSSYGIKALGLDKVIKITK